MDDMHFVDFEKYCKKCRNKDKAENENPCDECLDISVRSQSRKPQYYEERRGVTDGGQT